MAMAKEINYANHVIFKVANAEELPFQAESFDIILGNSVLHHIDLKKTFPGIKRILKKNGRLFFSEPNMLNPQVIIERKIRPIGRLLQNSPEETAFYRWSIASFLSEQGFFQIKITPIDFLHPATPPLFINIISRISLFLEKLPLIKELSGSLIIYAKK